MKVSLFAAIAAAALTLLPGVASAADLAPVYKSAPRIGETYGWSGPYIGVSAGYGWGDNTVGVYEAVPDPLDLELSPFDVKSRASGFIGGAQAGYNWQSGQWLLGVEADFSYADVNQSARTDTLVSPFSGALTGAYYDAHQRMDWFATLRPRLGVAVGDRLLAYVTGGLAAARLRTSTLLYVSSSIQYSAADTSTQTGWTVGGGLEWKLDRRWSAKTEYLYYDLGNRTVTAPTNLPGFSYVSTLETRGHILRAGLNYGWN